MQVRMRLGDIDARLAVIEGISVVELPGEGARVAGLIAQSQAPNRWQVREFRQWKAFAEQLHGECINQCSQPDARSTSGAARCLVSQCCDSVVLAADIAFERNHSGRRSSSFALG